MSPAQGVAAQLVVLESICVVLNTAMDIVAALLANRLRRSEAEAYLAAPYWDTRPSLCI